MIQNNLESTKILTFVIADDDAVDVDGMDVIVVDAVEIEATIWVVVVILDKFTTGAILFIDATGTFAFNELLYTCVGTYFSGFFLEFISC